MTTIGFILALVILISTYLIGFLSGVQKNKTDAVKEKIRDELEVIQAREELEKKGYSTSMFFLSKEKVDPEVLKLAKKVFSKGYLTFDEKDELIGTIKPNPDSGKPNLTLVFSKKEEV